MTAPDMTKIRAFLSGKLPDDEVGSLVRYVENQVALLSGDAFRPATCAACVYCGVEIGGRPCNGCGGYTRFISIWDDMFQPDQEPEEYVPFFDPEVLL